MRDRHLAAYGSVLIERGFCEKCQSTAFILDGKLQCCGAKVAEPESKLQVCAMSIPSTRNKGLKAHVKRLMIEVQGNKCFYCGRKFGSAYIKKNSPAHTVRFTTVTFDHVQPFVNGGRDTHNRVAACNLCNAVKSDKVFDNLFQIGIYTSKKLKEKYSFV